MVWSLLGMMFWVSKVIRFSCPFMGRLRQLGTKLQDEVVRGGKEGHSVVGQVHGHVQWGADDCERGSIAPSSCSAVRQAI